VLSPLYPLHKAGLATVLTLVVRFVATAPNAMRHCPPIRSGHGRWLTQRDFALAYSPGVAFACLRSRTTRAPRDYTARGNLVAVISNGTAVLGLGDIGALASKPVMEGKAVLFKKFAGIGLRCC
jgi:hypothetical protein